MAGTDPGFRSDNPLVQRLLDGSAPPPIRLAAARGALPITPEEQFHVLAALSADPAEELQAALATTLAGMPEENLAGFLSAGGLSPELLDFYARRLEGKSRALAAIASNRSTADATLEHVAAHGPSEVLELLVTNQVALIRAPRLIDTILGNNQASADQRRRVLEVREEFFLKKEREEKRRRDEEERLARLREKKEWSLHELEKLQEDLAREAQADLARGELPTEAETSTFIEDGEEFKSAQARIITMSVPEKVLLAIRGNRAERNLLIRDSNRLVATSVIKSPKLNDQDVEYFAGLRNVSDEILRYIGHRREWLRSYSVIHTLIKNPRTPLAVTINLLPRLQERDLRNLAADRGVSESLRRQAKQILDKAQKKAGAKH